MADCGLIAASITYDCENPLQGGTNPKLYLLNYEEVTGFTEDGSTDNLLTDISIASGGKAAYQFEGFRNSLIASTEVVTPDTGQNLYRHRINFSVFNIGQAEKNTIQQLTLGRFVAIIENNGRNEDSFEVLGLGTGLQMEAQEIRNTSTNGGAFLLTLSSIDGEFEPKLPQTLFDTDYATTLAKVVAYLTPTA